MRVLDLEVKYASESAKRLARLGASLYSDSWDRAFLAIDQDRTCPACGKYPAAFGKNRERAEAKCRAVDMDNHVCERAI